MEIRINQNIFSFLVQRNLPYVSGRLEAFFGYPSSGERINWANDYPTGLVTSEQPRYEVRSI